MIHKISNLSIHDSCLNAIQTQQLPVHVLMYYLTGLSSSQHIVKLQHIFQTLFVKLLNRVIKEKEGSTKEHLPSLSLFILMVYLSPTCKTVKACLNDTIHSSPGIVGMRYNIMAHQVINFSAGTRHLAKREACLIDTICALLVFQQSFQADGPPLTYLDNLCFDRPPHTFSGQKYGDRTM